jgi:amino acid adenylation domain-containing protein
LAILKAGGAYLPLDPAYPQERLAFMVGDAGVRVVVTEQALLGQSGASGARAVCLDEEAEAIAGESAEELANQTVGANLAYVIYTSGSTGQPKGVLVSHYNVTRLFEATNASFHFSESDVWTLFHSYAFDFSVWELWGALLHGGRLIVISKWNSRNPHAFYDLLCEQRVTVLSQVPSVFRQLIEAEKTTSGRKDLALRLIIFGGEALDVQSLKPWFDRHGDNSPQLVNMYGITETTVHVTYRPLVSEDGTKRFGGMIGKPIANLQIYLLDEHQQPVPIGVAGEIYVSGAGLARGYLNRPELSAERFMPNPYIGEPGARMYRSGDLARYAVDGSIDYLGRADHQVKIRGFRIELGEIEAMLGQHEAIRHAVVIARQEGDGDKRLVAYLVGGGAGVPSTSDLRSYLKERLPEHMIPSAFVTLESIPLTTNGKLNRGALPAPEASRPELGADFIAPRTPIEELLGELWVELLGVERVGVHDNFFDLGGHSILGTVMISSLRKKANVDLPVRSIFELPTIAELAKLICKTQARGVEPGSLPIVPVLRVAQRVSVSAAGMQTIPYAKKKR